MTAEVRGRYDGQAELWTEGEKVADVDVALTGFVDVVHVEALGYEADKDQSVSWNGVVEGLNEAHSMLPGRRVEIRLPTSKVGRVFLANNLQELQGAGWPPFPLLYNGRMTNYASEARN